MENEDVEITPEQLARLLRYDWSRRRAGRVPGLLKAARALGARARAARRRELVGAGLRACGVLGRPSLVRVDIDGDGDLIVRDLNGMPVAMVRPERDGSLSRVF